MADDRSSLLPSIPEFYAGRNIFITGATGFMGKVLVMRLLATCPDIGRLYLLVRTKSGQTPGERLALLQQNSVFDPLRRSHPNQLEKIRLVPGDITKPGLDISRESLQDLQEVSVIFHAAASVRFDMKLKQALQYNTVSINSLLEICEKLPQLKVFVYVSTAFCNSDRDVIKEQVYPAPCKLQAVNEILEGPEMTEKDTLKFIHPKFNTYLFAKSLAETSLEMHKARLQRYHISIYRPTIVVSSMRHPFPGWIENFYGPAGAIASVTKGLMHVFQASKCSRADLLPVDIAIDTLIAIAWETFIDRPKTVKVYNGSTQENPTRWVELQERLLDISRQTPYLSAYWYPSFFIVNNKVVFAFHKFMKQILPLFILEIIFFLTKQEKNRLSVLKIKRLMDSLNKKLWYFCTTEWDFVTDNVKKLRVRLSPDDSRVFNLDPRSIDWKSHHTSFIMGVRKHLMEEDDGDIPQAKARMHRLYLCHLSIITITRVMTFVGLCVLLNAVFSTSIF